LAVLPCVVFEDDDLLVLNKPAGMNTHAPSPYAGEGLYDWLRNREPRWSDLAIIHRLDKETSGLIIFGKTPRGNRSLSEQFENRKVRKIYLLLTDREVTSEELTIRSAIVRTGDRYVSRPLHAGAKIAETRFKLQTPGSNIQRSSKQQAAPLNLELGAWSRDLPPGCNLISAEPLTGRTHQIRVHAAEAGIPVLGDALYGGTSAARVFLHATAITLTHPSSGKKIAFQTAPDFFAEPGLAMRHALIEQESTTSFRIIHGASDSFPGWYVDRFGDFLLSQSEKNLSPKQLEILSQLLRKFSACGVYHKSLRHDLQRTTPAVAAPRFLAGEKAPEAFRVCENGMQFELSFQEGYSTGLFLDQRDNRRRLLTGHIAPGFSLPPSVPSQAPGAVSRSRTSEAVDDDENKKGNESHRLLNAFAYTCGFSVCAAKAGWQTTSLDLSKKYLEWGKRNFVGNGLNPSAHEFIHGDVFDWFGRLAKKQRQFNLILLDPPTFSQSKKSGIFRVEKDYARLVRSALPLLRIGGVLFASSNASSWPPESFLACINGAIRQSGRKILQRHYAPQPPDFPISRAEPAYLKTIWLRVGV